MGAREFHDFPEGPEHYKLILTQLSKMKILGLYTYPFSEATTKQGSAEFFERTATSTIVILSRFVCCPSR